MPALLAQGRALRSCTGRGIAYAPAPCRCTAPLFSPPWSSCGHTVLAALVHPPHGRPCGAGLPPPERRNLPIFSDAGTQTATRSPTPGLRGTPRKTGVLPRPAQDSPSSGNTRSVPGAPVGDSRGPIARRPVARRRLATPASLRRARLTPRGLRPSRRPNPLALVGSPFPAAPAGLRGALRSAADAAPLRVQAPAHAPMLPAGPLRVPLTLRARRRALRCPLSRPSACGSLRSLKLPPGSSLL